MSTYTSHGHLGAFCALTARFALATRTGGLADPRGPYSRGRRATRARLPSRIARTGTETITRRVIGDPGIEPPRRGEARETCAEPQITQIAQIVLIAGPCFTVIEQDGARAITLLRVEFG